MYSDESRMAALDFQCRVQEEDEYGLDDFEEEESEDEKGEDEQ